MNKDQVKGSAKIVEGKAQELGGKLVGSDKQQAKGLAKQAAGHVEKAFGDVKSAAKSATKTH